MRSDFSRREFIAGLGVLAAANSSLSAAPFQSLATSGGRRLSKSPFKIAVINDEISQDFGRACEVASQQFGMEWMELRSMWNKNVANLDANEIAEAERLLKKNNLRVTDIASPLFKVDCRARRNPNSVRNTTSSTPTLLLTKRGKFSIVQLSWPKSFLLTASAASISGGLRIRVPIGKP